MLHQKSMALGKILLEGAVEDRENKDMKTVIKVRLFAIVAEFFS